MTKSHPGPQIRPEGRARTAPDRTPAAALDHGAREISRAFRSAAGTAMHRVAFAIVRVITPCTRVGGIRVWLLGDPSEPEHHLALLGAALECLAETDPRRFALVQRYLRGIAISEHANACYLPASRLCVVSTGELRQGRFYAASAIVHEMTHARLHARGFTYTARTRPREERICAAEALRFLQRSDEGRALAEAYRARLADELGRADPWYSDAGGMSGRDGS